MADQTQIDAFLRAILGPESGGDPTAQNPNASASGLFGYTDGTWAGYGGYQHARDAPPEVQWAKARADVAAKLQRYGGDWRRVAMSWYYPAWVNDPSKWNSIPAPEAGNTKTLAQYADLVMARFTGKQQMSMPVEPDGATTPATKAPSTTTKPKEGAAVTTPKSQGELLDYIAENYPDLYGLLSIDSEVKRVILTAAQKEYTAAKLKSELAKTAWWKKTAAQARTWDADYARDKATGQQKIAQQQGDIRALAAQMGVPVSDVDTHRLAVNVLRNGWTDQAVREALGARFRIGKVKAGTGTVTVDRLRAMAAEYAIGVSDATLTTWTQRILSGLSNEDAFRSDLVAQAKRLYPTIADEITEDLTVRNVFDPYAQLAAQTLGLNPEEVDLGDSRWRAALTKIDPTTNKPRTMTMDEWETTLRSDDRYGFRFTRRGRDEAANLSAQIQRAMGYPA